MSFWLPWLVRTISLVNVEIFAYPNLSKPDMVDIATGRQDFSSQSLSPICFYLDDIVRFLIPHSFRSNIPNFKGLNLGLFTPFIWFLTFHSIDIRLDALVFFIFYIAGQLTDSTAACPGRRPSPNRRYNADSHPCSSCFGADRPGHLRLQIPRPYRH